MAYFTLEMYSHTMKRDTTVTVLTPTREAAVGKELSPAAFDGLWLLTRPGGLSTDWLRMTRHIGVAGDRMLVILPPWCDCDGYEEFLTNELPEFLSSFGLLQGAEHNTIGAHPESANFAEKLLRDFPESFGSVLPQNTSDPNGWRCANKMIIDYCTSAFGAESVPK